jgi:hypothetical protein
MRVVVANYSALDIARYRLPELTATSSSMVGIARWPADHTAFLQRERACPCGFKTPNLRLEVYPDGLTYPP